jgi:putative transposase
MKRHSPLHRARGCDGSAVSRYRLYPTPAQETALLEHCAHARFVWNLAVEQRSWRQPDSHPAPGFVEQCRQLTEARAAFPWLAEGSVTRDRAGHWRVAFAAIPPAIPGPGTGEVVGIDRGVAVSAALSTGELLSVSGLRPAERRRLKRLERRKARQRRGSNRRARTRRAIARLKGRESARRRDWTEKVSTDLARRFDLIRVEGLDVRTMTRSARGTVDRPGRNIRQKAALNRGILANGWGVLLDRLQDKALGRVEKLHPAYTSQRCSACGHVAPGNRESQAFRCVACGRQARADVNAAMNIAAGHAVTARGGEPLGTPTNREPTALGAVA